MNDSPKTNTEIRRWYLEQIAQIPELNEQWSAQGFPVKERAKRAWQISFDDWSAKWSRPAKEKSVKPNKPATKEAVKPTSVSTRQVR